MTDIRSPVDGSSPLARGTQHPLRQSVRAVRFIPAGAGNTVVTSGTKPSISVHPRWRGEHSRDEALAHMEGGSSPLARGTLRP